MVDLFDKCKNFTYAKAAMEAGLYPYFRVIEENHGPTVKIGGREILMMGSNSYLGLVQHPAVKEAAIKATEKYGTGCTGSRFLNGTIDLHVELEEKIAKFLGKEAAITFSTGFQANFGTIASLADEGEVIFSDKENHASIIDGARLSYAKVEIYENNNMEELERALQKYPREVGKFIVTDGVYSMTGGICHLPQLVELKEKYNARLLVDDAHALGILGKRGAGTAEHFGLTDKVDLIMLTFSKSLASLGGSIAGDEEVIHFLRHHARSHIFSASMPPANVAAVITALDILEKNPSLKDNLWRITNQANNGLKSLGFDTSPSETPIIPVNIGNELRTLGFGQALFTEGIFTNPVVAPGVPPEKGIIRTSYMASHQSHHIERMLAAFEKLGTQFELIP